MKSRMLKPIEAEEGGWPRQVFRAADLAIAASADGEDLLCGHCEEIIFAKATPNQGMLSIEGICPHCGGHNLLEA